jgi:hypothetical protein
LLKAEEWCEQQLGYRFRDPMLLDAALTHRSASRLNYERLEFLGDSVLNFVVALLTFQRYPQAPEGDLSRYRARTRQQHVLVCRGRLARARRPAAPRAAANSRPAASGATRSWPIRSRRCSGLSTSIPDSSPRRT